MCLQQHAHNADTGRGRHDGEVQGTATPQILLFNVLRDIVQLEQKLRNALVPEGDREHQWVHPVGASAPADIRSPLDHLTDDGFLAPGEQQMQRGPAARGRCRRHLRGDRRWAHAVAAFGVSRGLVAQVPVLPGRRRGRSRRLRRRLRGRRCRGRGRGAAAVDGRAGREQQLHGEEVAEVCGEVQRRPASLVQHGRASSAVQQHLDRLPAAPVHRLVQRRGAPCVLRIEGRLCVSAQDLHDLAAGVPNGRQERGPLPKAACVRRCSALQEQPHHVSSTGVNGQGHGPGPLWATNLGLRKWQQQLDRRQAARLTRRLQRRQQSLRRQASR
mmetsp:Transcript_45351/g.145453  ORF Transcript_45351/g.145453 Transcript_45351/m.145453 type:complete len:329 (+) Transcript_45351:353-1339(+)